MMSDDKTFGTSGSMGGSMSYGTQTVSYGGEAAPAQMQAGGADLVKDTTTAAFKADVMDESMHQPVLVDFWAPWCGPCRQLTPLIEAAVNAAGGAVKLVKMNIDEHPSVAGQLGVQSIPAVFAFSGGRPIDAFMGALPESEIAAFIDKVIAASGGPKTPGGIDIDGALEQAGEALDAGDAQTAAQIYAAVLQQVPENLKAVAGMAECYIAIGDDERAMALVDTLPDDLRKAPEVVAVLGKLELARQADELGDLGGLRAAAEAAPDSLQAKFDLALALGAGAGPSRAEACDLLVSIFKMDREWDDDGARKQLLKFFEAWGATDPDTIAGRRKLSAALFS